MEKRSRTLFKTLSWRILASSTTLILVYVFTGNIIISAGVGIAEALVTTAFGIGVAIIALWCYNFLNARIEVLGAEMQNTSSQMVDFFIRRTGSQD